MHIRGMFSAHAEAVEDVLLIQIDHAATSKFPMMFGMPGLAELFDTLRSLGDHAGSMWSVQIAGHLLDIINQQTNVIIATKQDGFTSSVPNLVWFCAVAAPFTLRVAIDTYIADRQGTTGRDWIAECKQSEELECIEDGNDVWLSMESKRIAARALKIDEIGFDGALRGFLEYMNFIQRGKESRDETGLKPRGRGNINRENARIRSKAAIDFGKAAWEAFPLRWTVNDF